MPSAREHIPVGIALGAICTIITSASESPENKGPEIIGGVIGGWIGAVLPDKIDSRPDYDHRERAHSWLVLIGIVLVTWLLFPYLQTFFRYVSGFYPFFRYLAGFIWGISFGYGSHLIMDSRTPMGLPFS